MFFLKVSGKVSPQLWQDMSSAWSLLRHAPSPPRGGRGLKHSRALRGIWPVLFSPSPSRFDSLWFIRLESLDSSCNESITPPVLPSRELLWLLSVRAWYSAIIHVCCEIRHDKETICLQRRRPQPDRSAESSLPRRS